MVTLASSPQTIHVAVCRLCGEPASCTLKAADAARFCPQDGAFTKLDRYQLAPAKKRTGRKPRKAWKR